MRIHFLPQINAHFSNIKGRRECWNPMENMQDLRFVYLVTFRLILIQFWSLVHWIVLKTCRGHSFLRLKLFYFRKMEIFEKFFVFELHFLSETNYYFVLTVCHIWSYISLYYPKKFSKSYEYFTSWWGFYPKSSIFRKTKKLAHL